MFGMPPAGHVEADRLQSCHGLEGMALFLPVQILRIGNAHVGNLLRCRKNDDHTVRLRERKRAKQNRIHYRKYGAVGADPQHKSRDDQKWHPRPLAHQPETESEILDQGVHSRIAERGEACCLLVSAQPRVWHWTDFHRPWPRVSCAHICGTGPLEYASHPDRME